MGAVLDSLRTYSCSPSGHHFETSIQISEVVAIGPRTDLSDVERHGLRMCSDCEKVDDGGRSCLFCNEHCNDVRTRRVRNISAQQPAVGRICPTHWLDLIDQRADTGGWRAEGD